MKINKMLTLVFFLFSFRILEASIVYCDDNQLGPLPTLIDQSMNERSIADTYAKYAVEKGEDYQIAFEKALNFINPMKEYLENKSLLHDYWGSIYVNEVITLDLYIYDTINNIINKNAEIFFFEDKNNPQLKKLYFKTMTESEKQTIIHYFNARKAYYDEFVILILTKDVELNAVPGFSELKSNVTQEDTKKIKKRHQYIKEIIQNYMIINNALNEIIKNRSSTSGVRLEFTQHSETLLNVKNAARSVYLDMYKTKDMSLIECFLNKSHKSRTCSKHKCILNKFNSFSDEDIIAYHKILEARCEVLLAINSELMKSHLNGVDSNLQALLKSLKEEQKKAEEALFSDFNKEKSSAKKKTKKTAKKKKASSSLLTAPKDKAANAEASKEQIASKEPSKISCLDPRIASSRPMQEEDKAYFESLEKQKEKPSSTSTHKEEPSSACSTTSSSSSGSGFLKKAKTFANAVKAGVAIATNPQQEIERLQNRLMALLTRANQTNLLREEAESQLVETQKQLEDEKKKNESLQKTLEAHLLDHNALADEASKLDKRARTLSRKVKGLQRNLKGAQYESEEFRIYEQAILMDSAQWQQNFWATYGHLQGAINQNSALIWILGQRDAEIERLNFELSKAKSSESPSM